MMLGENFWETFPETFLILSLCSCQDPSDDSARPLLPDPDIPEMSFPLGCARLAKLDEDELWLLDFGMSPARSKDLDWKELKSTVSSLSSLTLSLSFWCLWKQERCCSSCSSSEKETLAAFWPCSAHPAVPFLKEGQDPSTRAQGMQLEALPSFQTPVYACCGAFRPSSQGSPWVGLDGVKWEFYSVCCNNKDFS